MIDINYSDENLLILVGPNGSGKTYKLNEALVNTNDGIKITEDGMEEVSRFVSKVNTDIGHMSYLYKDEINRGTYRKGREREKILDNVKPIVRYCDGIANKLKEIKNRSKGQEKLNNIMRIFLEYNFNDINHIFLDEPENYLDEEYLKIIGTLINKLKENKFVIRIATHNSRLLKILDININQLVLISDRCMLNTTKGKLISLYDDVAKKIKNIISMEKMNENSGIKYKLDLSENLSVLESFIEENIKSESFYRCLFCKQIIIVEGQSDMVALGFIKNEFKTSVGVYNANGKTFIPFFVQLFLNLGKNVVVIIDDDRYVSQNVHKSINSSVALTEVLQEYNKDGLIKLVLHTPDLEKFYGIDLDEVAEKIKMTKSVKNRNKGWLKFIASFMFFNKPNNRLKLKNHILGNENKNKYKFE